MIKFRLIKTIKTIKKNNCIFLFYFIGYKKYNINENYLPELIIFILLKNLNMKDSKIYNYKIFIQIISFFKLNQNSSHIISTIWTCIIRINISIKKLC
jgi:hypothetical protein